MIISRIFAVGLAWTLVTAAAWAGNPGKLNVPTFVDPDEALTGQVLGVTTENATVSFALDDGEYSAVDASRNADGNLKFEIDPLYDNEADTLTMRAMTQDGSVIAEKQLPVAKANHHDITGDAAVVLTYEIPGAPAHVEFIPCCTIYNGLVRSMALEVNPAGTDEGLPEHIDSTFVVLKPDHLSATTMGLNLVMNIGEAPAQGLSPAVFSYNDKTGRWEAISDPDVDAVERTMTIACPNGGSFVMGWVPRDS